MIEIMKALQSYLTAGARGKVISIGHQLVCESQRHVMDADIQRGRLELLEPQIKNWHTFQSILRVIT